MTDDFDNRSTNSVENSNKKKSILSTIGVWTGSLPWNGLFFFVILNLLVCLSFSLYASKVTFGAEKLCFEANRGYAHGVSSTSCVFLDDFNSTENTLKIIKAGGLALITKDGVKQFQGENLKELREFLFESSQRGHEAVCLIEHFKQQRPLKTSILGEKIDRSDRRWFEVPLSYSRNNQIDVFSVCIEFSQKTPVKAFIFGLHTKSPDTWNESQGLDPDIHEIYRLRGSFKINGSNILEKHTDRSGDMGPSYAASIWELSLSRGYYEFWKIAPESQAELTKRETDLNFATNRCEYFRKMTTQKEKEIAEKLSREGKEYSRALKNLAEARNSEEPERLICRRILASTEGQVKVYEDEFKFINSLNQKPSPDENPNDIIKEMKKNIINKMADQLTNKPNVKAYVDRRISEGVKTLKASRNQQQIVAQIEQTLEMDSRNLVVTGVVIKSLLKGYDIYEREKSSQKILELARNNDPCGAYKETLKTVTSDVIPGVGAILSPIVSEIIYEATSDIYLDFGNRMAHWLWENGYSESKPRWPKDRFENGAGCVKTVFDPNAPTPVPPAPLPTPEPSKITAPTKVPVPPPVAPAAPLPIPGGINPVKSSSPTPTPAATVRTVPFIPVITPTPLPPAPFPKKPPLKSDGYNNYQNNIPRPVPIPTPK